MSRKEGWLVWARSDPVQSAVACSAVTREAMSGFGRYQVGTHRQNKPKDFDAEARERKRIARDTRFQQD